MFQGDSRCIWQAATSNGTRLLTIRQASPEKEKAPREGNKTK
jgi:hypothetical protein